MNYDKHIPLNAKYGKANVTLYIDFFRGNDYIRKAIDLKLRDDQLKLLQKGPQPFMDVYGHIFSKGWDSCGLVGYDKIN